jgi:hypothetical protein
MVPDIPNTGSAERVKLLDVIGKKMKAENRNKFQLSTFNFQLWSLISAFCFPDFYFNLAAFPN